MCARKAQLRSDRGSALIAPAMLVFLAAVAYHGCYWVPFFFDDTVAVTNNPTIRSLRDLGQVLSPPSEGSGVMGRPLINLSLAINYAISGTDARSYHLFNLVVHVLSALLLFSLTRRTLPLLGGESTSIGSGSWVAFFVAALWTVHPLQTESVTCVIQRTELLFTFFYLATLYCFTRSLDNGASRRWQITSVAACALGMTSKEVMVSAPLMVLLYDRTFLAGSFKSAWEQRRGYYLSLAATWLVLAAILVKTGGTRGEAAGFGLGITWWSYSLKQCEAIILYLRLTVWPHPLIIDYGTAVIRDPSSVAPEAAVLVSLVIATFWALARRPGLGFALFLFFAVLAPSSSVVPLVSQTIAEHRMYLPLAAVLASGVVYSHRLLGSRMFTVGGLIGAALCVSTIARNTTLQDEVGLWTETIARVPTNPRAHGSLALALSERGQQQESLPYFRRALELEPASVATEVNIGNVYYRLGDYRAALAHYRRGVEIDPKFASGHNSVGAALQQLGDLEGAMRSYRHAIELAPLHTGAHQNTARLLFTLNRFAEAVVHYEFVVRAQPDSADAHYNVGLALARAGDADKAAGYFTTALRLRPNAGSYVHFARFLADAGKTTEAIDNLNTALRLDPNLAEARAELQKLRVRDH